MRAAMVWLLLAAGAASAQDPRDVVRDAAAPAAARCRALAGLQERDDLDVPVLLAALGDGDAAVAGAALAILRHAVVVWPPELIAALEQTPRLARVVLGELAIAPRPSVDDWVARTAAKVEDPELSLLALVARAAPPSREEAQRIVRALASDDMAVADAARQAVRRIPAAMADDLLGVAHVLLEGGGRPEALTPLFERLSADGVQRLLGLAALLRPEVASAITAELLRRDDAEFRLRVRAAVDGEIPLDLVWLSRCGPSLDTEARRRRVAAVLAAPSTPPPERLAAFAALLEARVYEPELAAFADGGDAERWQRLFDADPAGLPDAVVQRALAGSDAMCGAALRGLGRRPLSAAIEDSLLELVRGPSLPPVLRDRLLAVLAGAGSDRGVAAALAAVAFDGPSLAEVHELLGKRADPIGASALRAEAARLAASTNSDRGLGDHLALVLAEAGDRGDVDRLCTVAPTRGAAFVRRCRRVLTRLDDEQWRALAAATTAATDGEVRVELLQWLGAARVPEARALLRRTASAGSPDEREAALLGLLAGDERREVLLRWRAGEIPDPDGDQLVAFAALATLPEQPGDDDIELLQYLLFTAPRHDAREAERALAFADGRPSFPLVAAIADRMRRAPELAQRVVAPARALAAAGDTVGLCRQRFLCLWTALQASTEVRQAVGAATAALVLAIPDATDSGLGVASLYLAHDLRAGEQPLAAAAAARTALRELLFLPAPAFELRIHLGVRDPEVGVDPFAELAALPWLCTARARLADGDIGAARDALMIAREFAGSDAGARQAIDDMMEQCR